MIIIEKALYWGRRIALFVAILLLCFPAVTTAQVPTYTNILTFTSPVRLLPTNPSVSYGYYGSPYGGAQVQVSSIGQARYLILTLNGYKDGLDIATNISYSRNYNQFGSNYVLEAFTNILTNLTIPSGGVFVFPMNPTNKSVTSQTPVFKLTNSSGMNSAYGVWNITNGFGLAFSTSILRTNYTTQGNNGGWYNTNTGQYVNVSYTTTNKYIFVDRWVQQSVLLYTTNSGSTWITNSSLMSGSPGYITDSGEGNHDLTNNYQAVLSQSNTNFIVKVYRIPN